MNMINDEILKSLKNCRRGRRKTENEWAREGIRCGKLPTIIVIDTNSTDSIAEYFNSYEREYYEL